VLAEGPYLRDELTLLVDVGTNAELVFGNRNRLLACSSPTGPAFEGAQISCGQRAAPGAIERVRIDRETLEPRFKVIGSDLWSDEAGFAESTRHVGVTGICGSGIIEVVAEMFLSGIITSDGVIDGALAERSPRIEAVGRTFAYVLHEGAPRLQIFQTDVRAIQLAKAALYAGAKLLLERHGAAAPERVTLAGAFGSHIDATYAMVLGLIPDCDSTRSPRRAMRREPARASPCSTLPRAARSRKSCGGSKRSKLQSSRASRNTSSPRWRCRTKSTHSPIWPRRSRCPQAKAPTAKEAADEGGDSNTVRDARQGVGSSPAPARRGRAFSLSPSL